jgi:LPS sulfotransferase NodH
MAGLARSKFCIFTTQRSGSTWLIKLLNSHPEIRCFDEMLLYRAPIHRRDPNYVRYFDYRQTRAGLRPWILLEYMDRYFDEYPGDYPFVGYKIMYDQLVKRMEVFYPLIKQDYKIIHLVRQNFLDILISKKHMNKSKLAHSNVAVKMEKVYLNPKTLMAELGFLDFKLRVFRTIVSLMPNQSIEICYEDLSADKGKVLSSVLDFIGVTTEAEKLDGEFVKMAKGTYAEKIENYEEVVQRLRGTRFAHFLEDKPQANALDSRFILVNDQPVR